jgi:hypothetical protein
MRFTVIGHSALFIEAGGVTILVDPWLSGSAGWRSWWHFPPNAEVKSAWLSPDYLYLTHHHPDHFHYPSVRRLDKKTRVLIPRFGVDVMAGELERLGFAEVREMNHAEILSLAPGVRVASYQYGFDDTTFVVADEKDVLVDLNDCKIRGPSMRQITRDFGAVSVALKAHSFAQAYPACYTAEDPKDLGLVARETYLDDFLRAARELRPRFAIPFGSMVAFLHPESVHVNPYLVTPNEVVEAAKRDANLAGTEVVALSPGDTWDSEHGFDKADVDWYTDRDRHLAKLEEEVRPKVERETALEAARKLDFEAFSSYFGRFIRALPWPARRVFLPRPLVFHVPSSSEPYWVLDFVHARVTKTTVLPEERASLLRITEGMLADAMEKGIVHFVHGSMRLRVDVRPGGINEDLAFWGFLAIWEIGYLPLGRLARARFLGVLWRRRLEMFGSMGALFGSGSPLSRLSTRFATPQATTPVDESRT